MKKSLRGKTPKKTSKRSTAAGPALPDLVTAMMRLVERLEGLERKTDQVLSRVSNLPSDMRNAVQYLQRPNASHQPQQPPRPDPFPVAGHSIEARKERMMYQAICADCRKNCEVPFRPTAERPVYCKECFVIRKAGHNPQDPDIRSRPPHPEKKAAYAPKPMDFTPSPSGNTAVLSKRKKKKAARNAGAKPRKKR